MYEEEIAQLKNTIYNNQRVIAEDSKWLALLTKVIPNFAKYEKQALSMVNEYGIIGALKQAQQNNKVVSPSASFNTTKDKIKPCSNKECEKYDGDNIITNCRGYNLDNIGNCLDYRA